MRRGNVSSWRARKPLHGLWILWTLWITGRGRDHAFDFPARFAAATIPSRVRHRRARFTSPASWVGAAACRRLRPDPASGLAGACYTEAVWLRGGVEYVESAADVCLRFVRPHAAALHR